MMPHVIMVCYLALFLSAILTIIRLILGPSALDRVLAFDAIALCAAGMAILFSLETSSFYFLEVLLIFSLLGFTSVLGYLDYLGSLEKGKVPKQKDTHDLE
jgi:multisubunit Na+/H+ antiporter MnhF subunit